MQYLQSQKMSNNENFCKIYKCFKNETNLFSKYFDKKTILFIEDS